MSKLCPQHKYSSAGCNNRGAIKAEKAHMSNGKRDDVLPQELRQNFNTMRKIIQREEENQKKRKEGRGALDDKGDTDLQRKKYQVAVNTALAVEREFTRLRNGIEELEALLAHQQEMVESHVFPALPAIVPSDEVVIEVGVLRNKACEKCDGDVVHG